MGNPESQVKPHLIPAPDPSLLTLTEEETEFLHHSISRDDKELRERILDVQRRSYEKYPYPCIWAFHFVNLMMALNPIYPSVVAAGKNGEALFLDLGCCMGTDVRKLVYDGYPAWRVLGCDLRTEYIDSGYTLFRDQDACAIRFFTSNAFDLPTSAQPSEPNTVDVSSVTDLSQLLGAVTHIYIGALFHLFDEETQYDLARRLALLLKRTPGATIFGRHQCLEKEGYIVDHLGRDRYGHSDASWPLLWKAVFTEIEGGEFAERVVVQAKLTDINTQVFNVFNNQTYMLYWSVQTA